ncbi:hypothetical protein HY641_02290 [Candidatus Woesearchaeota archaeon]|nr:hypothetical protein [Candidatus Woesearchaeota archaeon]
MNYANVEQLSNIRYTIHLGGHDHMPKIHIHRIGLEGIVVFVIGFFLNLLWESIHAVLFYKDHAAYAASYFVRMILYVSSIDGLLLVGILYLSHLFFRRHCGLEEVGLREVIFILVSGILIAAMIELKALYLKQWVYTDMMPTIFGMGFSPLIQLAVTGAISIFLTSKFLRRF